MRHTIGIVFTTRLSVRHFSRPRLGPAARFALRIVGSRKCEEMMKLAKITDEKIGLVVALPDGPHVVDIAESVDVFTPHDPLSNGLLNGAFKDGGDWASIVKHWAHLQWPLK